MKTYLIGMLENYLIEKGNENYVSDGTFLENLKAYAYWFLGGVPTGLVVDGLMLWVLCIIGMLTGKKLDLVDKK